MRAVIREVTDVFFVDLYPETVREVTALVRLGLNNSLGPCVRVRAFSDADTVATLVVRKIRKNRVDVE